MVACRGNATTTGRLIPPVGVTFHAVAVGDDFSCGLTAASSSLRCWGALPGGTAQLPSASAFFVDVHAGPRHVCGLVPNGTVLCYGDASSRGAINVPRGIAFQGVTAGTNYTCGVVRNHSVVCWGDTTNPVVAAMATWWAITDAEHVACGADHACYVRVNGSVGCWGSNTRGAATPPAALSSNGNVWWLAAGGGMTCAMSGTTVPGPVMCWGAVSGTITSGGYEVACAGWGCAASKSGVQVTVVAAIGGGGIPQNVVGSAVVAGTVATLAGSVSSGSTNGVGTVARFSMPKGVSLDGAGGLYVADSGNHVIRRVVIATRAVTTVAGVAGSSGRTVGANPLQSQFNNPEGVDVDAAGNVYVADTNNHAIRMLSGVWVAGSTTGAAGSTDAAGTSATFYTPVSVCAEAADGMLYVANYQTKQVRTIAASSSRAVATLQSYSSWVFDITLDALEHILYVAVGSAVYAVTYAGVSTLLAGSAPTTGYGDGTGGAARFNVIRGLALGEGVLYITDEFNHRLRRATITGAVVTTFAGSGTAALTNGVGTAAAFNGPWGIALDAVDSALYIGDADNHAIRRVQLTVTPLAPVALAATPLPPSPLAPTQQLTAWRALGAAISSSGAWLGLDARNATFTSPLSAANTAGLNPTTRTLLLSAATLVSRDPTPAAAGNINTTFSTSAQRGLRSLTVAITAVPTAALALPVLTNLTLAASSPTQQLQLTAGSFDGLLTLTCVNCAGAAGLANLSGLGFGDLLTQPPALPLITSLDASATGITAVNEHDFDGMPALRWLSVADNNLTFVSDAAFSAAKQPALAMVDQSNTPLATGGGCPATMYLRPI